MTQTQAEQPPAAQVGAGSHEAAPSDPAPSRLVPVSESIKYRRRAQQAEAKQQDLQQQLASLQEQVVQAKDQLGAAEAQRDEARSAVTVLENRLVTERLLSQAGVVDVEAANLLLSRRVDLAQELDARQLASQVEQLLIDKPFLRQAPKGLPGPTAVPRPPAAGSIGQLTHAAKQAILSGDRRDVAEYLRLRRQSDRRLAGR
jgi:hypothetical protein